MLRFYLAVDSSSALYQTGTMNLRTVDLKKLNSMTKYPSIPTYHALGERGALTEERVCFDGLSVVVREKIDGTNARMIFTPDGYLIGSREELLYHQGDLIQNPALGIVDAVWSIAEGFYHSPHREPSSFYVLYGEVYGGRVTASSKQYTSTGAVGFRLFDVAMFDGVDEFLSWPQERISAWRDSGGQRFLDDERLRGLADNIAINLAPMALALDSEDACVLPRSINDVLPWLSLIIPSSRAALDDDCGKAPEGVVVRTPDRKLIAKLRFEDYERHARRKR